MWVRSIVKGSIPRPGDDIRLSGQALDRDRRVALERFPELALQYPAGGFPGLRLEPNSHPEAIPAVRYAASRCRSSPGQVTDRALGRCPVLTCLPLRGVFAGRVSVSCPGSWTGPERAVTTQHGRGEPRLLRKAKKTGVQGGCSRTLTVTPPF